MPGLRDRMIRAAMLDASLYEEVEADRAAMGQAMTVVILSSLAAGVGSFGRIGMVGLLWGTITALTGWFVWALLTYWIGTRLLPQPQTEADIGQILRATGFSSSPGILRAFGVMPGMWNLTMLVTGIWMLVAMVIAVRQALDCTSTLRALGVCAIGWLIQAAMLVLLVSLSRTFPGS